MTLVVEKDIVLDAVIVNFFGALNNIFCCMAWRTRSRSFFFERFSIVLVFSY